jgi:hypothetical protein
MVKKCFLKKDEKSFLLSASSVQTQIIDLNPERSTKLEDFQGTCPYIINSPNIILKNLKKLLKEKFNIIIERKIELVGSKKIK